jgi:dTDP-4-dehydrorhamnose reductase
MDGLQLWGGVECTIARIGEQYRDQIAETGHHARLEDLDLIAELGIRTVRYPVLWEAFEPGIVQGRGWEWHDERMSRLRDLGIKVIVGLLHHGSGPRDTHLLDPAFPARLAAHARIVAQRYPWVRQFTPVNEPLTTARFSALYGHWYPHRRSYPDFLRALVHQCRAIVLSMEAIREVTPGAKLVQTEDIGRVFATPGLADQADHENDRRWLSLDLLFGRVDDEHPFWRFFRESGIEEDELRTFDGERPPDLIGINHYPTSDRYLDQNPDRYPPSTYGSNGRQTYADAEAVRIAHLSAEVGLLSRIREVGARYPAPMAVTEVHHGCSREEQLRWLFDLWNAGQTARREGYDLRAVTVWSLFGACDWNSLLTQRNGAYEPGAFDVRGHGPRPTVLARAAQAFAKSEPFSHPVLARSGWWKRGEHRYHPMRGPKAHKTEAARAIALLSAPRSSPKNAFASRTIAAWTCTWLQISRAPQIAIRRSGR